MFIKSIPLMLLATFLATTVACDGSDEVESVGLLGLDEEGLENTEMQEVEEQALVEVAEVPTNEQAGANLPGNSTILRDGDAGNVVAACGICGPNNAKIYNGVPNMTLGKKTNILFFGQCLPPTLAFWIADCAGMTKLYSDCGEAKFSCTPSYSAGTKAWVIKDKPGGKQIKAGQTTVKP